MQSNRTDTFETPEDRFKRMILERLNSAHTADAEGNRGAFCSNIRHLLRLMKSNMSDQAIDRIEQKYEETQTTIEQKTAGKSREDVEAITMDEEYKFYNEAEVYAVDAMLNSRLFQREIPGLIQTGGTMEGVAELGKKIRGTPAEKADEEEAIDGYVPEE